MAYHNNTPQSVLDAPAREIRVIVGHTGTPRWSRRHYAVPRTGRVFNLPRWARKPATNVPYVKPRKG
jgi:hypothetical protein